MIRWARRATAAIGGAAIALLLAGCGAPGAGALTALPRTVQQPFADQGATRRLVEVRRFVVAALSAEVNAYRRTDAAGGLTAAQRVSEVRAFEAAPLAAQLGEGPPLGMPDAFGDAGFQAVRWQGVAVRDDRAKAYVIGHQRYLSLDGAVLRGPAVQVQVLLQREPTAPHGWLVVAEAAVSDEQVESVDPTGPPS
jgi:hypothetical protein